MQIKAGGYIRNPYDERDFKFPSYKKHFARLEVVGTDEIFIPINTPVSDQGNIGSCVANAICDSFEIIMPQPVQLSRLFLYWNSRNEIQSVEIQNPLLEDGGTFPRAAYRVLKLLGAAREETYPYDGRSVHDGGIVNERPSLLAYEEGYDHKITGYAAIDRDNSLISNIMLAVRAGHPVTFGTDVGSEFMSYQGDLGDVYAWLPPGISEGGHCMAIVGYQMRSGHAYMLVRNSWSIEWGMPHPLCAKGSVRRDPIYGGGYFWMHPSWLSANMTSDFATPTLSATFA